MRLHKTDWLEAGLTLLKVAGPRALTIEQLCRVLQVTKGSYYHHFGNREGYQSALIAYWREQNTEQLIATTEAVDPQQRSQVLSELARSADAGVENAMRTWAQQDAAVAQEVATVDLARTHYLERLIAPRLSNEHDANLVAKLIYSHFVGVQQLPGLVTDTEWENMDKLLMETFLKV
ncbi:TetR/AcrR family transcriptional regulator [Gilvimarinus agarilyticus]|uniref:TetR/AcrR family transcriptional regulator n=1 Tax=Gilvimarinus sp. 2_MG-2023 TaxID=3062666 RepID=UPI001C092F07|nr:TetR/AcrR family transcriptional regulator [Gilvimarinus sp. 2_MG-2023]MBU2885458.1 TetR/AcrR family transcriptional regulator [Gilvimarinus agarilyticus]MDO6570358.1 TetR/AcrR family transcriptional regulator [Gilvimarinus sp. 2_MG-2023]